MLNPQAVGKGKEQYEMYRMKVGRKMMAKCQYDYRHVNGELFSCVAPTLEAARAKRDNWLANRAN